MKKSARKLIIASMALVATLALTITSTFAWFNMNEKVSASFDFSITADSGFSLAVVNYEYTYTGEDKGIALPSGIDPANLAYKQELKAVDFGDLFVKNWLNPVTVDRDTTTQANPKTGALDFKDVSGNDANKALYEEPNVAGTYKVPYLKFRLYFTSTVHARDIYIDSVTVSDSAGYTAKEIKLAATDEELFSKLVLGTSDSEAYSTWKGEDKSTAFSITDDTYFTGTGTVSFADGVYSVNGVSVKSDAISNAVRVAFEGDVVSGGSTTGARYIHDAQEENTALEADATTNFGWIYYNFYDSTVTDSNYLVPVQRSGDKTAPIVTLLKASDSETNTEVNSYGFVDVTIWLEGFDADCFESIIGTGASYNFIFSTTQPSA